MDTLGSPGVRRVGALAALSLLVAGFAGCRAVPQPASPAESFKIFQDSIKADRYRNAWELFTKDTQDRYKSEEFAMLFVKTKVGPLVVHKLRTWKAKEDPGTGTAGRAVFVLHHPLREAATSRYEFVIEGKIEGTEKDRWAMRFFLVDELGMPREDEERLFRPGGPGAAPALHRNLPEKTPDGADGVRADFHRFQNEMITTRTVEKPVFLGVWAMTSKWTHDHYGRVNFVTLMGRTRLGQLLQILFSEWQVTGVEMGPGEGEASIRLQHPTLKEFSRTFLMCREGERWRLRLSLGELLGLDVQEEEAILGARYKDEDKPSPDDW